MHRIHWQDVTADFVYVRLHGDTKLYESGYSKTSLQSWSERVQSWQRGQVPSDAKLAPPEAAAPKRPRDVYVYFDNDAKVRAPFDALALTALLSGRRAPRAPQGIAAAGEPARTVWPAWISRET